MKALRFHHLILLLFLILIVVATGMIETVWTERNYDALPDMYVSVPVDAQTHRWKEAFSKRDENPASGTVSMVDTVAKDIAPFQHASMSDSARLAAMEKALPRGEKIYRVFCVPCHGSAGLGDGVIAQRGYPPPPSLLAEATLARADSALYRIVSEGQGNMPSYSAQITHVDRWNCVAYVRSLQNKKPQTGGSTP